MRTYPQDYIDVCRSRVDSQLAAYRKLVGAARVRSEAGETSLDPAFAAFAAFEVVFFNNMVLVLNSYFDHRLRSIEGMDGNALNEVRIMCNSMRHNNDTMAADTIIKMNPTTSVLRLQVRDRIRLNEQDFRRLAEAFFVEIETKYGAKARS